MNEIDQYLETYLEPQRQANFERLQSLKKVPDTLLGKFIDWYASSRKGESDYVDMVDDVGSLLLGMKNIKVMERTAPTEQLHKIRQMTITQSPNSVVRTFFPIIHGYVVSGQYAQAFNATHLKIDKVYSPEKGHQVMTTFYKPQTEQ